MPVWQQLAGTVLGGFRWELSGLAPTKPPGCLPHLVPAAHPPQGYLHLRRYLESRPGKRGRGKRVAGEALSKGLPCPWEQGDVGG